MKYNEFLAHCTRHKLPVRYQPTRKRLHEFFDLEPGEKMVYYRGHLAADIDKQNVKSVIELRDVFLLLMTPYGEPFRPVLTNHPTASIPRGTGLAHGTQTRIDEGFEYWAIRR